jgi:hypothetical protein
MSSVHSGFGEAKNDFASFDFRMACPTLWTPPDRHLTPSDPLSAPLGQALALWNKSLMDRAGQHSASVPADLAAEVLAGDADSSRAGKAQDISIQMLTLLRRQHRASSGHHRQASTSLLLTEHGWGQVVQRAKRRSMESQAPWALTKTQRQ